jgi:hypothetical protein
VLVVVLGAMVRKLEKLFGRDLKVRSLKFAGRSRARGCGLRKERKWSLIVREEFSQCSRPEVPLMLAAGRYSEAG